MAKKLILLLLLVPIIVMISLFAATKTISIMVEVPVSGITVSEAGSFIYLDMDKKETHSLEYTVYPINAQNKEITATAEPIKGKPTAELDFALEDGKVSITPKSAGSTNVCLTTKEGGYSASITVHVESKKALELKSIECTVSKDQLKVGETATISTIFTPQETRNSLLHYESDNEMVVSVEDGEITALREGVANIKITADANKNIYDIVTVTVSKTADASISKPTDFSDLAASGSFIFNAPEGVTIKNTSDVKLGAYSTDNGKRVDLVKTGVIKLVLEETEIDGNVYYAIRYEFTDPDYSGTYSISVSYKDGTNDFETSIDGCEKIKKDDIDLVLTLKGGYEMSVKQTFSASFVFSVSPVSSSECTYSAKSNNSSILSNVTVSGSSVKFEALNPGVTTITLTATLKENSSISESVKIKVYVIPFFNTQIDFNITNPLSMGGGDIEKIFTLGKYEYPSQALNETSPILTSNTGNKLNLGYVFNSYENADSSFAKNLKWEVVDGNNNEAKSVYVDENGVVKFIDETDSFDGMITVRALFGGIELGTYELRCVSNGINVYSYLDLYRATTVTDGNGIYRSVVLRNTVKDDFGVGVNTPYKEIETTYDVTYLKETKSNTKIKVLIEFRSNVYGNGYEINADNLTYGNVLFQGPLNFIAMSPNNSGVSAVSVKGQDNICFAVYEGVTINNVTLRGSSPDESVKLDLVDLDNTGTVVEIFGTDTTIEYSRIKYGRTVIRAFGDINDPTKKINLNIKNSILSEAREFIIRAGSNCFVDGDYQNTSPTLEGAGSKTHLDKTGYNDAGFDRASYDEKYIKTDITIDNVVFRRTGLFAIGIDSHFASKALANGKDFVLTDLMNGSGTKNAAELFVTGTDEKTGEPTTLIDQWTGLSKTSYGAKIKFKGEVILDTWKPINDVDSSTLISVPAKDTLESLASLYEGFVTLATNLNFDVQNMLKSYNTSLSTPLIYDAKNNNNYSVDPDGDGNMYNNSYYSDDYVHGGIVFFGGGKNYGAFDTTELTSSLPSMPIFKVTFSDIGSDYDYLKYAAGEEPFFFAMYNASHYGTLHDTDNPIPGDNDVVSPKR